MSTTTFTTRSVPTTGRKPFFHRVPVSVVTAAALLAGGVATEVYSWIVRAAGADFVFGVDGSERSAVPTFGFIGAVVTFGALGILLAPAVARWAKRPRHTWTRATWALAAISLVPVAVVAEADVSTKLALAGAHLVAAAVVIPMVASRLAADNRRRR